MAGTISRGRLQELIAPLEQRFSKTLVEGGLGDDARVAKFCENLLNLESALWKFAQVEGVEPTNNFMERLVRLAVLWRRRSFGCNSLAGCRFVERILTVVQTCRLRNRNIVDYLANAVEAHRSGRGAWSATFGFAVQIFPKQPATFGRSAVECREPKGSAREEVAACPPFRKACCPALRAR